VVLAIFVDDPAMIRLHIMLLGALLIGMGDAAAAEPDIVIVHARVFTADPDRPWAQAVAVQNGRILEVGDDARIGALAGPRTRVVDAGGRLLVPGLTEAHVHIGWRLPTPPIAVPDMPFPGPSPEAVLAAVSAASRSTSGWISAQVGPLVINDARNWRQALDKAAPNRPVILRVTWGHGTLLSTAALKALAIADGDPDPVGGWFGRDAGGRLDGRATEAAETLVHYRLARLFPERMGETTRATAERYLQWGVTSVHVMASGAPLDRTVEMLGAARSPLKWSVYAWAYPVTRVEQVGEEAERLTSPASNIRVVGVKWVLDGTPIERLAHMRDAYADAPGWRGRSNYGYATLRAILADALARPNGTALHVVGDGELARLLSAMESLAPTERWRAKRVRVEHGEGLAPDLISRAARLGVVVVQNPLHLEPLPDGGGREMMASRIGERRLRWNQPLRALTEAGITLAFGSDAGGPEANPFLNLAGAISHRLNPPQALAREQALLAYTSGGAYAEGLEAERGMIRPSMAADLALLSQDVLSVPAAQLPATTSVLTLIDGRVAYEQPLAAALLDRR
jgi:hypothetical protein